MEALCLNAFLRPASFSCEVFFAVGKSYVRGEMFVIGTVMGRFKRVCRGFLDRMGKNFWLTAYPHFLSIAVIDDCNYRCQYCFGSFFSKEHCGRKEKSLSNLIGLNVFKALIDDLAGFGKPIKIYFNYGGSIMWGEPFLHPDIMAMLAYVRAKGFSFSVLTNGSLIHPKMAEKIIDLGVENICVSLNAANPKTYSEVTQSPPEFFPKACDAVASLVGRKRMLGRFLSKISISMVLNTFAYKEVLNFLRLGRRLGVDCVSYRKLAYCEQNKRRINFLLLNEGQKKELSGLLLEVIAMERSHSGLQTNARQILNSMIKGELEKPMTFRRQPESMRDHSVILGDGTVYAMNYSEPMGNVNDSTFPDIWSSEKYLRLRKNASRIAADLFPCYPYCRGCGAVPNVGN